MGGTMSVHSMGLGLAQCHTTHTTQQLTAPPKRLGPHCKHVAAGFGGISAFGHCNRPIGQCNGQCLWYACFGGLLVHKLDEYIGQSKGGAVLVHGWSHAASALAVGYCWLGLGFTSGDWL